LLPQDHPLLNEHQRRHFEVLLAGLENSLAAIEDLAARTDHVETAGYGAVDPRVKDVIEPELHALHTLLASIKGRLAGIRAGGDR
jgi:hypothetical protein